MDRASAASDDCEQCAPLREEIARLRSEVARLRRQKDELARAAAARDFERPPHYQ